MKRNILLVKLAGIGDFVLALPALKSLFSQTEDKITLLCTERVKGLAERLPYFKEVVSLKDPFFSLKTLPSNFGKLLELRRRTFDVGINFHSIGSLRGALFMRILFGLLRMKESAGFDTQGRGFFLTHKFREKGNEIHEKIKYLDFARTLGGKGNETDTPELPIRPEDEERMEALLKEKGGQAQMRVGLQPGGNKEKFLWPIRHFARIARHLHERHGATLFVTGNDHENKLAQALQADSEVPMINVCGLLPLEIIPAFLSRLHLFLSNDTGLAHIAGAVGTPLVAIFGPCSEERFYPCYRNQKGLVIHRKDVSSIAEISAEEVILKIDEFLRDDGK